MLTWPEPDLKPINLWSLPLYKNDYAFNFETTNAYKDMQWLKSKNPESTEADREAFADKVAHIVDSYPHWPIEQCRDDARKLLGWI